MSGPTITPITPTGTIGMVGQSVVLATTITGTGTVNYNVTVSGGGTLSGPIAGSFTGTLAIPVSYALATAGVWVVTVTATDSGGTTTATDTVIIDPLLPNLFNLRPSGHVGRPGAQVRFSIDATSQPTAWAWIIDNGATPSTSSDESPLVILGNSGTYHVTVQVTNANGTSTFVGEVVLDWDFPVPNTGLQQLPSGAYDFLTTEPPQLLTGFIPEDRDCCV